MGYGQKMEYSLSGFLSKLKLLLEGGGNSQVPPSLYQTLFEESALFISLVVLLIEKIIPRLFLISFAAKCVKLGL